MLQMPDGTERRGTGTDILEWLSLQFGFQVKSKLILHFLELYFNCFMKSNSLSFTSLKNLGA